MIRYLTYLLAYLIMQVIAYLVTPILPIFARDRLGNIDNNNAFGTEPRLPKWLSWFDTPDNSLLGDNTWKLEHSNTYLDKVKWLYRNSLYGFKWSVLAAPENNLPVRVVCISSTGIGYITDGDSTQQRPFVLDYRGPIFGLLTASSIDGYWQYKRVLGLNKDYCLILNFGWLIENGRNNKSLFMFSPRLKKIKYISAYVNEQYH